ncbi:MAG: hypothetical protein WEB58_21350, partial [Planctomycetaceae bacterium]
ERTLEQRISKIMNGVGRQGHNNVGAKRPRRQSPGRGDTTNLEEDEEPVSPLPGLGNPVGFRDSGVARGYIVVPLPGRKNWIDIVDNTTSKNASEG